MCRIDDALRREGTPRAEPAALEAVGTDVFVSPWTVGDDIEHGSPRGSSSRLLAAPPSLIDRVNPEWRDRQTVPPGADPMLAHQFRRLAATLLQAQWKGRLKSVMITSAAPGDGKP